MTATAAVDQIEDKVRSIVAEVTGLEIDKITLQGEFMKDIPMDSLDIVEMMMKVEEGFGLDIPDEDAEKIPTVGDLVNYVRNRS